MLESPALHDGGLKRTLEDALGHNPDIGVIDNAIEVLKKMKEDVQSSQDADSVYVQDTQSDSGIDAAPDGVYKPDPPRNYSAYDVVHIIVYDT